jgi:predicted metal-dependent peptidase
MANPTKSCKAQGKIDPDLAAAQAKAALINAVARATILLDFPFFAAPMLRHKYTERLDIPTMAVDPRGQIYYNPKFIASLTGKQVVFGICHEVLHYLSGHASRYESYCAARALKKDDPQNRKLWNYAGDYWINETMKELRVGEFIVGGLEKPGANTRTVEDLMDELLKDPPPECEGMGGLGEDIEHGQLTDAEAAEVEVQRKLDVETAVAAAKQAGNLPGALREFAADVVQSEVPWYEKLARFMTDAMKHTQTWTRPQKRYAPSFYLPDRASEGSLGEIVVQIDVSGSISENELAHYNGHMQAIIESCNPRKIHVLYTDTDVQKHEIFDEATDFNLQFYSGGGTDMTAGYDYCVDNGIEPTVFITLTDGYTPWGEAPDFPVLTVCSTDQTAPYGETVPFKITAR